MKFYIRLFLISFACFMITISGIFFAIESASRSDKNVVESELENGLENGDEDSDDIPIDDDRTELRKIADSSSRVNVIAFGLNEMLADTMMLISFDPNEQKIDILSIPRDTYHHIEGYDRPAQKKMNAVYGMREVGGALGMKKYLSEFLDIPVHYYIRIDFKAVETVVDVLGGYSVYIPFDMIYDDIYDSPPLHINFKKGQHHLNGADAVKYLRFRQNNDGSVREGDIQRIPRQQAFVNAMLKKALGSKLPSVINTIINNNYIKTDLTIEDALTYAMKAAGMPTENITFYTIEGHDQRINGLDYWIHDPAALDKTLMKIYGYEIEEDQESESNGN